MRTVFPKNTSNGVLNPTILRGQWFSRSTSHRTCSSVTSVNSIPLGEYCLVARCCSRSVLAPKNGRGAQSRSSSSVLKRWSRVLLLVVVKRYSVVLVFVGAQYTRDRNRHPRRMVLVDANPVLDHATPFLPVCITLAARFLAMQQVSKLCG